MKTNTMLKTTEHPLLPWTITFDPGPHTYTDNLNRRYTSVTTLVKSYFPPFDAQAAASRIARKTNALEFDIIRSWNQKRDESAKFGTNVHAFAEAMILGQMSGNIPKVSLPASPRETRAFAIVERAIDMLSETYDFIATEQIIFDPLYQIAGQIDIVARNRETGAIALPDWKTCEEFSDVSFNRALPPIQHLSDNKLEHYALQLSLYALMLTDADYSAYPTQGESVELALIHISPASEDPIWIPLPNRRAEAIAILEHHQNGRIMRGEL
jgi:hypothetical protein